MSLWVAPVILVAMLVAYALSFDARRWWRSETGLPEAVRWWRDQRRELRRMQAGEESRTEIFDQLETEWAMPCAPDPRWRV